MNPRLGEKILRLVDSIAKKELALSSLIGSVADKVDNVAVDGDSDAAETLQELRKLVVEVLTASSGGRGETVRLIGRRPSRSNERVDDR